MIELYSGTPGSGKSLHTVHEIRDWLICGKNVISSCYVDTDLCFVNVFQKMYISFWHKKPKIKKHNKKQDNFYYIPIEEITPDYLYRFAAKHHVFGQEHQTVVFLDECVAIFSPTVLSDKPKIWNEWDTFFRKHRHLGYDIVLIPQSVKLISRKVKEYCEFETKHYNRKNQGFLGWLFSLFCGGSLFSWSKCWRGTGQKPFQQGFFTYKPLFGLMYNSYSMFDETLKPYKEQFEKEKADKKALLKQLCTLLNERRMQLEMFEENL